MSEHELMTTSDIKINGICLGGRLLVIEVIDNSTDFNPETDLHVAPLVGSGKLISLENLKKDNEMNLLHNIWRSVCLAMDYIHGKGHIHGLLSPDKIVWDDDQGRILILEWNRGTMKPSHKELPFCPPESLGDKKITLATDIYFLTALLFFMETGIPLHREEHPGHLKEVVRNNTLPVLSTLEMKNSAPAWKILSKGLETAPGDRYSSVMELLGAAAPLLEEIPPRRVWPFISSALITYLFLMGVCLWSLLWAIS